MSISTSKRNFLRGQVQASKPIRPPWSLQETEFIDVCNRCGDCIKHCPMDIIKVGDGGFPVINFSTSGCDFCHKCVDACEVGALNSHQEYAFTAAASISDQCFSERGIMCRSCGDVCENQAFQFRLAVGGVTHVELNTQLCNGCGECVSICPAHAISIEY